MQNCKSCQKKSYIDLFDVIEKKENQKVIALAGNPNTGKSTVFNALTGLKQHTGNWPGKTVKNAHGYFKCKDQDFILVDLPGTYSLMANSPEEQIARDFICFGNPDVTIVVADATCLERNLNLALQVMEITDNVILCVNLLDEAKRKKIFINLEMLSEKLGIPVIGTIARNGKGLTELVNAIYDISHHNILPKPLQIIYSEKIEEHITELLPKVEPYINDTINPRWVALRIINGDDTILERLQDNHTLTEQVKCLACKEAKQ